MAGTGKIHVFVISITRGPMKRNISCILHIANMQEGRQLHSEACSSLMSLMSTNQMKFKVYLQQHEWSICVHSDTKGCKKSCFELAFVLYEPPLQNLLCLSEGLLIEFGDLMIVLDKSYQWQIGALPLEMVCNIASHGLCAYSH